MATETVKLIAGYSTGCFCPRPDIGSAELRGIPYRPFQFARAARQLCQEQGWQFGGLNKYKSAWATLAAPCQHRQEQHIRIDWTLDY